MHKNYKSIIQNLYFLFIFLIPFQIYFNFFSAGFTPTLEELILITIFISIVLNIISNKKKLIIYRADILVYVFYVMIILSVMRATIDKNNIKFVLIWLLFFLAYFIPRYSIDTILDVRKSLTIIFLANAVLFLFAIFQFIIGPENILDWITGFFGKYFMDFNTVLERISQENYHWRWNNTVKAFGTFVNVNTFCAYLGLSFPIALALCILTPNKKTKKLLFLYLTLNCIVIVLTFSRGGLLSGLFVAVYIILLLNKYIKLKTKLRITFMFIIVALIAYTVLHQVIDIMLMRLQTLDFSSNYERILLWKGAWNVITDNMFFGVGVGNYEKIIKYYLPLNAPIAPAHNNILQLWAEVGLIGLSPFLLLILILMQQLIRISIHSSEYLIKSISAGLSGSFLWFLTQGMLSVFYFELKYGMLFWLLIGITVVLIRKINKLQWYTGVL